MSERTITTPKGTTVPLRDMRGKDYLDVKYRLVWFREEHPDWSVETKFLREDATSALAQATIKDASGRIMAMSHKLETKAGFADYHEKAETGAIGRALALCGHGSQFADVDEDDRIVDSPAERPAVKAQATTAPSTDAMPVHIQALIDSAKAAKLKKADLEQLISLRYHDCPSVKQLDQAQCKTLISDILKTIPPAAKPPSVPPSIDDDGSGGKP